MGQLPRHVFPHPADFCLLFKVGQAYLVPWVPKYASSVLNWSLCNLKISTITWIILHKSWANYHGISFRTQLTFVFSFERWILSLLWHSAEALHDFHFITHLFLQYNCKTSFTVQFKVFFLHTYFSFCYFLTFLTSIIHWHVWYPACY